MLSSITQAPMPVLPEEDTNILPGAFKHPAVLICLRNDLCVVPIPLTAHYKTMGRLRIFF